MKKNKKLSMKSLVEHSKSFDKLRKITFEDGVYTEIYENFSNDRIDSCLNDFGVFLKNYENTHGEMKQDRKIEYIGLHILLWFSTLTEGNKYSYEEKIALFDQIVKSDYFEMVMDSFNKNDLAKVFERMQKKLSMHLDNLKQVKSIQNEIKNRILSSDANNKKEILNVFFGENMDSDLSG